MPGGSLHGQVALVTGASRGIGRALTLALAARGVAVAAVARDRAALDALAGAADGAVLPLPADVTSPAAVDAALAEAVTHLGPPDLLVAAAGALTAAGALWETDPDTWWDDVAVNLRGAQLLLHAVLPGMVERGRGRCLLLGSGFGTRPTAGLSAYASSKAALHHLAAGVAEELAGTGVTVHPVSPGMVRTDMTRFPDAFLAYRPELRDPPEERWTPMERSVGFLLAVAGGAFDDRSGEYVHVSEWHPSA